MLTVVEPHADDAFLSLHDTLRNGDGVRIVTVFGSDRRMKEAERYAETIGAEHVALGYPESKMSGDGVTNVEIPYWEGVMAWPLGIQHPDHRGLRKLARPGDLIYGETPYLAKQKNREEINRAMRGLTVYSYRTAGALKWKSKWTSIFRTQSAFFFYELENCKRSPELLLRST